MVRLADMKPIRVALSGSGFKFPAHVGALMALHDAGYEPVELAGTSGGSIVAALAATGAPLPWLHQETLGRDWSDMLTFSPWSVLTKGGYCSGSALLDWLTTSTDGMRFADLKIPLTIIASDINALAPFEFSKVTTPGALVALAARASAAIPFAYAPVQLGRAYLQDGGMVNNIPVDRLAVDDVPRLGVQLVSASSPLKPGLHTVLDIAPRLITLMLSAQESTHVDLAQHTGATVAFVETGYADGLDRNMSRQVRERLMQDGYTAVLRALPKALHPVWPPS